MKNLILAIILVSLTNGYVYSQDSKKSDKTYSNGYMLGVAMTRNLSDYEFSKQEISDIIKGFTDGLNKKTKSQEIVDYEKVNSFINEKRQINASKHKKEGIEYLNNMTKEQNSKKYDSGLVMVVQKEGSGEIPSPTDRVKVHYKGYLINGKTFDSSYDRGQPVDFVLNQVIPCWTEALTKVKVGSKVKIGCPSEIAYGDRGIEPTIPGGSTLIFDVELLDIIKETPKKEESDKNLKTK